MNNLTDAFLLAIEALEIYADKSNWITGESSTKNVWHEPGSSTPLEYDGYEIAVKILAEIKSL